MSIESDAPGTRVVLMQRLLDTPIVEPVWPDDITFVPLAAHLAPQIHQLMVLAYENDKVGVAPFDKWWDGLIKDAEYDSALCFIICDDMGLIGFAQCWTSVFVKDLVIHPRRQGEGLGQLLLQHVFNVFQKQGAKSVDLKALADNTPVIRFYQKMGMRVVEEYFIP